jgi:glycosyltransferase involved in cell wall biosynthesis
MGRRLLFVVNHAGFFLSHRLPVALAAHAAGYDVHVATPQSKHVPRILANGLTWHPIRLSRAGRNPLREVATLAGLYRLYRELRPDIVHHVTSKPVLYGTVVARAARMPAVVNAISGMGHMFSHGEFVGAAWRRAIAAAYGMSLRHPRMRVIFQNTEHMSAFVDRGWVDEREAVLIPGSGVDVNVFRPRERPVTERPLVVLASRMLWTKGVGEFVEAARLLTARGVAARFALVGEPDPDNPGTVTDGQLREWAAEGVVECWGRREDMADVFASADVAALPSASPEGVPKALIEAAASGLPIVATDIAGCRAVVTDGENGFIVPVRDATALADALARLIADPALRARFGAASRARAVATFSIDQVVEAHLAVYDSLCS